MTDHMASHVGKPTDLLASGPLVAVKLWVPMQVKSPQSPIDALGELNIALAHTYIQEGVATSLGLEPSGKIIVTTATKAEYEAFAFRLRVAFPDNNMAFEVRAVEVPYLIRPKVRIKCLIGRDILKHGVLTYNGPANTFSLNFSG